MGGHAAAGSSATALIVMELAVPTDMEEQG
jgi:hypothetical protein